MVGISANIQRKFTFRSEKPEIFAAVNLEE